MRMPLASSRQLVVAIVFAAQFSPVATAQNSDTPQSLLAETINDNRALTRTEYLGLLTGESSFDPGLLIRGLASFDANTRKLSALQLGDVEAAGLTAEGVRALVRAVRDSDEGVSDQAIASILRIGQVAPASLLPLVRETTPLRKFRYESDSANGYRRLDVTASDLAIAGLYYGADADLCELLGAYEAAVHDSKTKAGEGSEEGPTLEDFVGFTKYEPGGPEYFARALSLLLEASPDAHAGMITEMLASSDPRLRSVGYGAAGLANIGRDAFTARLAAAVRGGPESGDRSGAARALARQGADGTAALLALARLSDPAVRAAAISTLVDGADCNSQYLALVLGDPDGSVRQAALAAMLEYRDGRNDLCFAMLALDAGIEEQVRSMIINRASRTDAENVEKTEALIQIWRPILSDAASDLYEVAWRGVTGRLSGQSISSKFVVDVARERLRGGITDKDEDLLCALSTVDARFLAGDEGLIGRLIGAINDDLSSTVRECIGNTLAGLDWMSPANASVAPTLLAKLTSLSSLTDDEISLVEYALPLDLFAREWRRLADSKTGASRVVIYRVALSRGVAVDEPLALFADVLSEKNGVLGVLGVTESDDYALRYDYMPPAIKGLFAASDRGLQILGKVLRGEAGTPRARVSIVFELIRTDAADSKEVLRARAAELSRDFAVATKDGDAEVRNYAVDGLSLGMRGGELVEALRPLFADPDRNVLYTIGGLIADEEQSDFKSHLSEGDATALIGNFLGQSDAYAREKAAQLLVSLRDRLSARFVSDSLSRMLRDDDERPRQAAIDVLGTLAPIGASVLASVLFGSDAGRIVETRLSRALVALGDDGRALLPQLLSLQTRYPGSGQLLEAIGAVGGEDGQAVSVLESQLLSDDEAVRASAIRALSPRHFFRSQSPERYAAALIEERVGHYVEVRLGAVLENIRPHVGPVPLSARGPSFPQFPWPPPPWSFKEVVPKGLLGAGSANLGQVSDRLVTALREASSDFDYGLFEIPGGFVVLARLERINPDGTPLAGRDRWNSSLIPPHSLEEYLVDLFLSPPGYFRLVAFAVTKEEPLDTNPVAELPRVSEGGKTLPDSIAKVPFSDREAYALVYTFHRYDGGKMELNYDGSPSGLTHLMASGIWSGLQKPLAVNPE